MGAGRQRLPQAGQEVGGPVSAVLDGPGGLPRRALKDAALALEGVIQQHAGVVEWQSNPDVQRLMRRDIKRELRPSGNYGEPQLDDLANRIVELAQHRRG